jgi:hypothetical protein
MTAGEKCCSLVYHLWSPSCIICNWRNSLGLCLKYAVLRHTIGLEHYQDTLRYCDITLHTQCQGCQPCHEYYQGIYSTRIGIRYHSTRLIAQIERGNPWISVSLSSWWCRVQWFCHAQSFWWDFCHQCWCCAICKSESTESIELSCNYEYPYLQEKMRQKGWQYQASKDNWISSLKNCWRAYQ